MLSKSAEVVNASGLVGKMDKSEVIRLLDESYKNINLKKLSISRSDNKSLAVQLAKYSIEADKLNIFLVYTGARKRAPVYSSVPKNVMEVLHLKSVKTAVPVSKWIGFCDDVITKSAYLFSDSQYLLLNGAHRRDYPVYSQFDASLYNKKSISALIKKGYIDIKSTQALKRLGATFYEKSGTGYWFTLTIKGQNVIDKALGRLFNYPKCCINAFVKKKSEYELKSQLEAGRKKCPAPEPSKKVYKIEDFSQFDKFGLSEDFLPYYKCSAKCEKSKRLTTATQEYINISERLRK